MHAQTDKEKPWPRQQGEAAPETKSLLCHGKTGSFPNLNTFFDEIGGGINKSDSGYYLMKCINILKICDHFSYDQCMML